MSFHRSKRCGHKTWVSVATSRSATRGYRKKSAHAGWLLQAKPAGWCDDEWLQMPYDYSRHSRQARQTCTPVSEVSAWLNETHVHLHPQPGETGSGPSASAHLTRSKHMDRLLDPDSRSFGFNQVKGSWQSTWQRDGRQVG
jgi:hypothetical protein